MPARIAGTALAHEIKRGASNPSQHNLITRAGHHGLCLVPRLML